MSTSTDTNEMQTLMRKRSSMKAKLTSFTNYITTLLGCKGLSELQRTELDSRFIKFESLYVEFDGLQAEIEILTDKPEEAFAEREVFEQRYYMQLAQARVIIRANEPNDRLVADSGSINTGGSCQHNFIRLPKIDLPHFNGCFEDWLEFRDTFLSLIHNSPSIDNITKFHYLRASVRGVAADIIKNIDFNGENYATAWDLLCCRYNKNRLLIDKHVQGLFNIEPIAKESGLSLHRLLDSMNKNIRALKSLEQPTEYWDTLIVYVASTKLDLVTHQLWQEYRSTFTEMPKWDVFCEFINNRADLFNNDMGTKNKLLHAKPTSLIVSSNHPIQYVTNQPSTSNNYSKSNNNNVSDETKYNKNNIKCPLCSENHVLYTCTKFRSLSIEDRIKKAMEFRVCMNCLRLGHVTKRCRLARCNYCNRKHNTLLHVDSSAAAINFQEPMPPVNNVALPANASMENVVLPANTISNNVA